MNTEDLITTFFPNGVDNLADTIGPQSNILTKIENFNRKYILPDNAEPLKITKKWRWSPGTYDKVKVCYTRKIMQWHRRPRHMYSIFNRRREWYANDMKRELNEIENALIRARRECELWLDKNTDDGLLEQVVAEFAYNVNALGAIASKHNVRSSFWQATHNEIGRTHSTTPNALVDNVFIFLLDFPPIPIAVTKEGKLIEKIKFPALSVYFRINITKWFGAIINPGQSWPEIYNTEYFAMGINYNVPKDWIVPGEKGSFERRQAPIYHPFANRPDRMHGLNTDRPLVWRNICMGNYQNDVMASFMNMDWGALIYHLSEWLFKYEIINANPLNNIRFSFLGIDNSMNTELLDIVGYDGKGCASRVFNTFRSPLISEKDMLHATLNFCESTRKCTYMNKCEGYKINADKLKTIVELSSDQKEMLKWAKDVSRGRVGQSFEDTVTYQVEREEPIIAGQTTNIRRSE